MGILSYHDDRPLSNAVRSAAYQSWFPDWSFQKNVIQAEKASLALTTVPLTATLNVSCHNRFQNPERVIYAVTLRFGPKYHTMRS